LTEISIVTKQIVNEIGNATYKFDCPDALAFDGTNIWVANWRGNSLTEIDASTGALIRTISGSNIEAPISLAVVGTNLWVGNFPNTGVPASFAIINTVTGNSVKTLTQGQLGPHWTIEWPICMVAAGMDVWVADQGGVDVSEFNGRTGAYLRHTVAVSAGSLSNVGGVSYHSGLLWASGSSNYDLVEYKASTGAYVRSVQHIDGPGQLLFTGSDLFVILTTPHYSVGEYNSSGRFIRTIVNTSIENGRGLSALAFDGRSLWVANYDANSVSYYVSR